MSKSQNGTASIEQRLSELRTEIERRRREALEIPDLERQVQTLENALRIMSGEALPTVQEVTRPSRLQSGSLLEIVAELEEQGSTVRARIIRALLQHGKPMPVESLLDAVNREQPAVSGTTLSGTIQRERGYEEERRRIVRVARGWYGLREWGEPP